MRLFRPTDAELQAFVDQQARCEYTYTQIGASAEGAPPGFTLDFNRVLLGEGNEVFAAACSALSNWQMFPAAWTRIYPRNAPIAPGTVVALQIQVFGTWWLNSCRIVYVVDETHRFGFAYGTLPAHVECGEERFLIECDDQHRVWYSVRAFSRPRHPLVRLAYSLARRLQLRFVRDSQAAMQTAVAMALAHLPEAVR